MKGKLSSDSVLVCDSKPILFLTNNRSSQQLDLSETGKLLEEKIEYGRKAIVQERIKKAKDLLRGRLFETRTKPSKYCGKDPIAFIKKGDDQKLTVHFTKITCNSWRCPSCQIKKAIKTKYLLRDIILLNNLHYFLTLTLDPDKIPIFYLSPFHNDTHKYITKLFNHFLTVLKRKTKINDFKYIWVIEFQKNGNAHLHILFNTRLSINKIRELWTHVGGGHIMRVEEVKTMKGISLYITDYIVKGIKHNNNSPSYFHYFEKRYSISRSCARPKKQIIPFDKKDFSNKDLSLVYNTLEKPYSKDFDITL